MGKTRRCSQSSDKYAEPQSPATGHGRLPVIEELRSAFAQFRAAHPCGTRIPDSLRAAAINAIRNGVEPAWVRNACGISADQLVYWINAMYQAPKEQPDDTAIAAAQVFPVLQTEELPKQADSATQVLGQAAPTCLEFRVGGFAISIRALSDTPALPAPQ
jgi:hypothetical protein